MVTTTPPVVHNVKGGRKINEDEYHSLSSVDCLHDTIVKTHECCFGAVVRTIRALEPVKEFVFVNVASKVNRDMSL